MTRIRQYILDSAGVPRAEPDVVLWGRWFEASQDLRRVARDELPSGVAVSTVFLGLDHGFDESRPPLLYQTMVFGGPHDGDQDRYATREEALAGHARMVMKARRR